MLISENRRSVSDLRIVQSVSILQKKQNQNHAIVLSVPAIMLDVHSNNPNLLIKRKLNKTWETKRRMIINKTWDELWMM